MGRVGAGVGGWVMHLESELRNKEGRWVDMFWGRREERRERERLGEEVGLRGFSSRGPVRALGVSKKMYNTTRTNILRFLACKN